MSHIFQNLTQGAGGLIHHLEILWLVFLDGTWGHLILTRSSSTEPATFRVMWHLLRRCLYYQNFHLAPLTMFEIVTGVNTPDRHHLSPLLDRSLVEQLRIQTSNWKSCITRHESPSVWPYPVFTHGVMKNDEVELFKRLVKEE